MAGMLMKHSSVGVPAVSVGNIPLCVASHGTESFVYVLTLGRMKQENHGTGLWQWHTDYGQTGKVKNLVRVIVFLHKFHHKITNITKPLLTIPCLVFEAQYHKHSTTSTVHHCIEKNLVYPGNGPFLLHGCALWFRFSLFATSFKSLLSWLAGIRSCCYFFFFFSLQLLHKKETEILMTET